MFFLIPWNTDAPIYHRPVGTIALIVLNVVAFIATFVDPELAERMVLPYGQGFTPVQCITSNFIHGGIFHLLGNMVFLWGFGLVVEGKLGWRVFVPIYLGIGMTECAMEQALFWNGEGASFGASAIIYGLMSMCLIWAPRNDLQVFYFVCLFYIRAGLAEWSIVFFSALHLGVSLLSFSIELAMGSSGSELLHLLGAAVGAAVAVVMLRRGWVDCEGWDLFSVMSGELPDRASEVMSLGFQEDLRRRKLKKKTARARRKSPSSSATDAHPAGALPSREVPQVSRFEQLLQQHKPHAAHAELVKIRHVKAEFRPSNQQLLELARGLRRAGEYDPAVKVYEELLAVRPDFALGQIELAALLALSQNRPAAALRCLQNVKPESLPPQQRQMFNDLLTRVQMLLDSGVVELDRGS